MSVVRCPKGHFYDDQRFSRCPHCGILSEPLEGAGAEKGKDGQSQSTSGEKKKGLFGWLDREKTVAFHGEKAAVVDEGKTVAFHGEKAAVMDEGKTVAFSADKKEEPNLSGEDHTVALKKIGDDGQDDQKTIGFFSGAKGNDFVTGWLVCVEGEEKGRDYRLHHGFNRVGRSFSMDVQVMEDPAISREGHCSVVYDDKTNQFSLIPSHGAVTYFQGRMLGGPEILHSGDEFCIGNSRFVFIPFCGEGRVWEKEEE